MKWTGSCRFRNIINEMYCCSFSYLLVLLLITVPLLHSRSTVINRCLHVCVLVVALSVSSLAHTTKTTVPSSTWSTRPASHTWVCSHICIWWEPRLIKAAVTTLCVCVCAQGYWGCAIGKAKQAAKTEIEKLQVSLNLQHSHEFSSVSTLILDPVLHLSNNHDFSFRTNKSLIR